MASIINASPSNGIVQTADGSGIIKIQSNSVTTNALAWVRGSWNGSTLAVNSSYNISSITRNSAGYYTFAFSSSLSDANYSVLGTASINSANSAWAPLVAAFGKTTAPYYLAPTTSSFTILTLDSGFNFSDVQYLNVAVFGN